MIRKLNVSIRLTNLAINQIEKLLGIVSEYSSIYKSEDILSQMFEEGYYDYYLQNATRGQDEETKVRFLMSSDTNNANNLSFINKFNDKILTLEGVNVDENNFLIININLLPRNVGSKSNKSILVEAKFYADNNIRTSAIPQDIMNKLSEMPNAKELYKKVDKKIKDWDNYLAIIEENARESQLEIKYKGFKQQDLLTHCVFSFDNFTSMQIEKLKKFRNERVILFYKKRISDDESDSEYYKLLEENIEDYIGIIDKINFKNNTIEVELEPEFQELALEGKLDFPQVGNLRISKMGDLTQARNLRRGLKLLRTGQAHNPNLDVILFDSKSLQDNKENNIVLNKSDLLLKTLNDNQKSAVEGVLNAKDLFLIQGPPGTGKTTVIAEICYQNAIRGKKTLIASQSNLAVDNALSRLIHNPKIRVLRKGNLSRVEKEGEKYTENNVVDTWMSKTADSCEKEYKAKESILKRINELESNLDDIESSCKRKNELEKSIVKIRNDIETKNNELQQICFEKGELNSNFKSLEDAVWECEEENAQIDIYTNISFIVNTLNNALLKLGNYDNTNLLNKLNASFSEIEEGYKVRCKNQIDMKKLLYKIKCLKNAQSINNTAKDIEIELNKIQLDNYEAIKYLELAKTEEANLEEQISKLNLMIELKEKMVNSAKLLQELKKKYNINDIVVVDTVLNQQITNKVICDFECEIASLYNNKPNKFFMLLGLKKSWKVEVETKLHMAQKYIECINSVINEVNIQKDIYKEKRQYYIKELFSVLRKIESDEGEKFEPIKNEINLNNRRLLDLKRNYEENKESIKSIMENQINMIQKDFTMSRNKLEEQVDEVNKIIEKIQVFNNSVREIFHVDLSVEDVAKKDQCIKEYYKKIIEPKKFITNNYVEIVGEWINRIRKRKYGDKKELNDLYINTANVIGITCVQSGNKDFTEKYPDFDVVIVDEVSKATPPELVLPMLKGKKIVLVGDHKQLPPMIGSETFEELKELNNKEVAIDSEADDLEYMKKSLFEELFINVPESNKIMLNVQYRMHSSIMDTINQFYIDSQNKGLICGVENEEVVKNHKLHTKYFNENNNLIWVDIPLHKKFYEKINSQNSFYNETEIEVIAQLLEDINNNCEDLKIKKEVAVITFYGAQARLMQKEFISSNKFKNLKVRVGTVDRFQGMEREIVIVSFVRNNNKGNIGFAKDPKRINVALSRAQNLLIIVGCSELFCEKNFHKKARENYKNVLKVVDTYNGIIDAKQIFN